MIWTAAREAGATVFLSEDLQDGLAIEGMRVINPFNQTNSAAVAALLDGPIS